MSDMVANPEDRFSRAAAQFMLSVQHTGIDYFIQTCLSVSKNVFITNTCISFFCLPSCFLFILSLYCTHHACIGLMLVRCLPSWERASHLALHTCCNILCDTPEPLYNTIFGVQGNFCVSNLIHGITRVKCIDI